MAKYICTNLTCGASATFKWPFGNKTCTTCGHDMAAEGSAKAKSTKAAGPLPHLNGPAVKLPEPPLLGHAAGTGPKSGPPKLPDLAALKSAVASRETKAKSNAAVDKRLVFKMTPTGGTAVDYDMPIKYQCWKSGLAKQDLEVTIKIPVKVYGGAEALQYWQGKGWSTDLFRKTVHQGGKTGVQGAAFNDDVRRAWSAKANKCWGKAGVVWTRPDKVVLKYSLRFEFLIVDRIEDAAAGVACVSTSGEARGVNPTGTIDAVRWGVEDTDPNTRGPICHEVGHLIGNPDEYFTIEHDGRTKAWGAGYQATGGIMNNPNNAPFIRNFKPLALELANAFGIPPAEAEIVEDLAMLSTSKKHKLTDHIWG